MEKERLHEKPEAEKLDLKKSTKKLYVTDLGFVLVVGVISFLISWLLWRYSNSMSMRFTGWGVASFGYVLSIYFFWDATFLFFSKRDY